MLKPLHQDLLVSLQVVNCLLHLLELSTHLIALIDSVLQLFVHVRHNFYGAFKLLDGVYSRHGCACIFILRVLAEELSQTFIGIDELVYTWEF